MQTPKPHVGVAPEQPCPQLPQLFESLERFTSHPSACLLPLQSANPEAQAPLQKAELHVGAGMLLLEQASPQAPQLPGELERFTSQPSTSLL